MKLEVQLLQHNKAPNFDAITNKVSKDVDKKSTYSKKLETKFAKEQECKQ